jgi:DNA-binding SARP family transcriptional activator/predicted ATPase
MLVLHLLGGLQIMLNEKPVTGFVSSKVQALLCYLALTHSQAHLRSSLATMFWGDMPDEDAATNLRQAVANLKRLLEPYFDITRQTIAFNADTPHWIDVHTFEKTRDVTLYTGELLAGFGVADAPDFDDWLTNERERLHELALSILREQAALQRAQGDDEGAMSSLNRLLRLDPLQESAHRQLMMLLATSGQRAAALAQYEKCREILKRELNLEPEAETARLYERIRTAQRIATLPNETTPFIGRTKELNELIHRLQDPTCHLITIVGLGGMGKTRLALRLAHQQCNCMLHGAVMVNLTSIRTLDSFLSALMTTLRLQMMAQTNPRAQLIDFLREKHLLIVLDNVEQLVEVINDFLQELTRTAPDLKIVMTSRQRFNVRGEWTLVLDGLPIHEAFDETQLPPAQSLFWETARRVRGDDLLTQKSAQAVQQICELVQGMPLAIELAAAWSRLLTVEELAQEIASNVTILEAHTQPGEERHRSLRAVFDYSWQLFSAQEQRVLMALALFPGGFTRSAAQAVAGASIAVLLGLSDKMLVQRQGEGRFMLHEMLRRYLAEKLGESSDLERVQNAYLEYFIHFLQQRHTRLKTGEQQTLLDEITQETDNLQFAWDTAVGTRNTEVLMALIPGLSLFYDLKTNWRVAAAMFQHAESAVNPADTDNYGLWLSHLSLATSRLDQPELSAATAQRCLAILSRNNPAHLPSIARALMVLGYLEGLRGAHETALAYLEDALALRHQLGDDWDIAQCLMRLASAHAVRAQIEAHSGEAHEMQSHLEKARPLAQKALSLSGRLGDQFLTARLQTMLANIALLEGHIDESTDLHRVNLGFYEAVGSLDGLCMTLNGIGNTAMMHENYRDAIPYYLEAISLARQIGARAWEANTLNNLAVASFRLEDLPTARHYYQQSQAIFHDLGHDQYVEMIQKDIDTIDYTLKSL